MKVRASKIFVASVLATMTIGTAVCAMAAKEPQPCKCLVEEQMLIQQVATGPIAKKQKTITEHLGVFTLTAYCGENYPHICNDGDSSQTATGTTPVEGRTIAVDPDVIPYGSTVIINGHEYIAEDCGGDIQEKRIDIFFDSHETASDFGIQKADVYILKESK